MITILHLFGRYSIKKIDNPNNRASEDLKNMFKNYWSFMTTIMPYFLFFLFQCLYVISF
jgi:ABC-type uncharacterized transport system fused permease/ATPase subunit